MLITAKCRQLTRLVSDADGYICDILHSFGDTIQKFTYYRICSRNLRTFFSILAAEKSGCVKYADFFCGGLDLGFILV